MSVVTEAGVRIGYEVRGTRGPWIVLVQGHGYGRWGWEPVADRLARGARVVLIDNRGIGQSDSPPGPYSLTAMAGDVRAVMEAADVADATVVGTSLGGFIVQELALADRSRIARLVLVSTHMGGTTALPMPAVTMQLLQESLTLPREQALRRFVHNALSPTTARRRPEVVERIMEHRLATAQDPAAWQAQAGAGATADTADRLPTLDLPVLIIQGTIDNVVDAGNAKLLADLLPDARVEMFEGAGHLVAWDDPDRFVEVVRAFAAGREP